MLDLSYSTRLLSQGQRAATMTLALRRAPNAEAAPTRPAENRGRTEALDQPAAPDPSAVAERVYQLMRQDLRIALERRG